MTGPLPWATARRIAAGLAPDPGIEVVPLDAAAGRVLAADLVTSIELPHYASAAMDGWAVRGAPPWRLVAGGALEDGDAAPIVTGGAVPSGATSVLRSEAGSLRDGRLVAIGELGERDREPGRHIRPSGSEAGVGETLAPLGARLTPPRLALAAAAGFDELAVRRRLRVALVLTGDEVIERGVPAPGQVRDSFRLTLPDILTAFGAEVAAVTRVGDDRAATAAAIAAERVDVVVTTGGSARSSADHVRDAVADLGGELVVPGVAMRPGGPTLLARCPDRIVLGLPGNPLAAILAFLGLGAPLVRAPSDLRRLHAGEDFAGRAATTRLVPVRVAEVGARAVPHVGSGMLRGLAAADAVLVVPEDGVPAQGSADALPLPWNG